MSELILKAPAAGKTLKDLTDAMYQGFGGFGGQPNMMQNWLAHIGRTNLRAASVGGELIGGLGIFWFKQMFGGRALDSAGVSVVTILPEARGTGNAAAMMRRFIRDLREQGCPLSVLYPSTYGLYRKAGYECAGSRIEYEIDLSAIGVRGRQATVRRLTDKDRPELARLHLARARAGSGLIDRAKQSWFQLLEFGSDPIYSYGVEKPGGRGLDGYIIYNQAGAPREPFDIRIRDACAATPAATRAIQSLLAGHVMIARRAFLIAGPGEPLLTSAGEDYSKVSHRDLWMLRIVDVRKSLEQRGYPPGLSADVHFDVSDDVCPDNEGRWRLRVQGGRGDVTEGGTGALPIDIRGLAALYTGHQSAHQLQTFGLAEGADEVLSAASAVFAAPAPWLNDRF